MDHFWMVFVEGANQPRKQWEIQADAQAAAERLAKATGKPAYLLKSVAVCFPIEPLVRWEETKETQRYYTSGIP